MSVLVSDRTESKFEAITYSIELHDMLIDFMQRSFGVKDLDQLVRVRYAHGKDAKEDFSRYRYLMLNYKNRIDQLASMLTSNVRAANSIYPTTLHEYEQRRDYQNTAIEYATCMSDTFNKLDYRNIPESKLTGEKWMEKSVNIGDQLSQVIGIYYPYRIDNYVKYVRSQKFYGRYMDDWYIMNPSKEELFDLLDHIHQIAEEYGIHINKKKTRIVKISSTYKFLQIKYSLTDSGKVIKRINPKRVTTMRRKLKKLAVKVKNEEITYENVENMFRGWMGSFYKLLSKEQRKNLIGLYEDLFEKSITIISKRMIITDKIK